MVVKDRWSLAHAGLAVFFIYVLRERRFFSAE